MKLQDRIKTKGNKGITLIALVITIIVLLILAGVTIAALSGDNGILKRAAEAKQETEKNQVIEMVHEEDVLSAIQLLNISIKQITKFNFEFK